MQIKKIVSGGQTGADRAALDFAIEYGIEHGGWVPRGRRAEDGIIALRYNVRELPDGGYPERTERNVIDSDATLIVSHGELAGGSRLTGELAQKHARPCLHIDLYKLITFDAAIDIHEWILAHNVGILNVAGSRASKDPEIYRSTYNLLETAFHIDVISHAMPDTLPLPREDSGRQELSNARPDSVGGAVDELMRRLSALEKMRIASTPGGNLEVLRKPWGARVCHEFELRTGNHRLLKDCRDASGISDLDAESAAMVVVRALWEKLRRSGHLRVVR